MVMHYLTRETPLSSDMAKWITMPHITLAATVSAIEVLCEMQSQVLHSMDGFSALDAELPGIPAHCQLLAPGSFRRNCH